MGLRRWGAAIVVLVAVAPGCAKLNAATTPTKAEYVGAADSVCTESEKALDEVEREAVENPDTVRNQRWIRAELVPAYRGMSGALRSIPPPTGDEVYLSSLYTDLDHVIDLLHASPSKGRDLVREDADLRRRFSSYGMKVCGRV